MFNETLKKQAPILMPQRLDPLYLYVQECPILWFYRLVRTENGSSLLAWENSDNSGMELLGYSIRYLTAEKTPKE